MCSRTDLHASVATLLPLNTLKPSAQQRLPEACIIQRATPHPDVDTSFMEISSRIREFVNRSAGRALLWQSFVIGYLYCCSSCFIGAFTSAQSLPIVLYRLSLCTTYNKTKCRLCHESLLIVNYFAPDLINIRSCEPPDMLPVIILNLKVFYPPSPPYYLVYIFIVLPVWSVAAWWLDLGASSCCLRSLKARQTFQSVEMPISEGNIVFFEIWIA